MELIGRLRVLESQLSKLHGVSEVDTQIHAPVSHEELDEVEKGLGVKLPDVLREVYVNQAGGLSFSWGVQEGVFGERRAWGDLLLMSPARILHEKEEMSSHALLCVGEQGTALSEGEMAMVNDWPRWIPFVRFRSGDYFCLDPVPGAEANAYPVVFMEHDVMDGGPFIHGIQLAPSALELFNRWSSLGFLEVSDWSTVVDDTGLDLGSSELAEVLRKFASQ